MRCSLYVIAVILAFFAAHPAFASTHVSGALSEHTTWTKAQSPYMIDAPVTVPSDITLTIEPGVVVKMGQPGCNCYANILVSGTVIAGSPDATERVTFTSIHDDLGGDDDGSPTLPQAGDWRMISVSGRLELYHTDVRYGGYATYPSIYFNPQNVRMINNMSGVAIFDDVDLSFAYQNAAYRQNAEGNTTITNSRIHDTPVGLDFSGGQAVVSGNTWDAVGTAMMYPIALALTHDHNRGTGLIVLSGTMSTHTTIPADGLSYTFTWLTVPTGLTLTIAPGATLKGITGLAVDGTLLVGAATATERVTFTSLADDAVGGDSNSDGNASTAQPGGWGKIFIAPQGVVRVFGTTFRYGGSYVCDYWGSICTAPMLENSAGTLTLADTHFSDGKSTLLKSGGETVIEQSEFAFGPTGILVVDGTTTIHHSSLHDLSLYGIVNQSPIIVDATENWWGVIGGPTHSSNPFGGGVRISDHVEYGQWLTSEPQHICVPGSEGCNSNVLFLPGLEASRMYRSTRTGETGNEKKLWEPSSDSIVRDLFLDGDGKQPLLSESPYTRDVIDEAYVDEAGPNIYKTFLTELNSWKNTEHIISDYAVVPYDWRFSPQDIIASGIKTGNNISYIETSPNPYIKSELARLVASSRTGKVTIIAHSYGGLVAKMLLKQLEDEGDPLLGKVDNLILVASPQVGTPQAMGGLLYGYEQGIPKSLPGPIQKLTEVTAREFGENLPGAYALLPSGMYFSSVHDINHPLISFDNSTAFTQERLYYGNLVGNLNELYDYLLGAEGREKPFPEILSRANVLNPNILGIAHETHVKIDGWIPPATMQLHQIAGWGEETLVGIKYQSIPVVNGFGTTEIHTPDLVLDGDGTVLVPSALWVSTSTENVHRWWVNLIEYNKLNTDRDHASILEVTDVRKFIKENILTRTAIASPVFIKDFSPSSEDLPKHLNYFLHSPLSLSAYDDNGNEISSATSTIPGARYREFGEVKYISVPASAPHHLVLDGYATGEFTLEVQEVQGDTIGATTTFVAIPTSTTTNVTMDFTDGTIEHASPLLIDEDGNGTIDFSLAPKLGDIVTLPPLDSTPPITTASITGTLGANTRYTSNVTVALSTTDMDSEVASTSYSLDNGASWIEYTVPFTIPTEGGTTILYYSTDTIGNREAMNTLTLQIDKTAPEAMISVSTSTQDLLVEGKDTLGTTTITKDTAGNYTLTDQAGHTTTLFFTKTYSGKRLTYAKLTGIQYDGGIKKSLPSSSFVYLWDIKTSTALVSQTIAVDGTYIIQAVYDKVKDKTTILVLKKIVPIQTQTYTGLRIPKLTTNKGVVGYSL